MTTTTSSGPFSLNWRDFLKGLLVAVLSPVFTIIMTSLNAGELTFNWKVIGAVALAALLSYLLKNFLTPAQIVITDAKPATVEAVKNGEAEVSVKPT
jgi:hypothetical protein